MAADCAKLHPACDRALVCGRHLTATLGLWGRRRRPPCTGECGKAHPSPRELEDALHAALPAGQRLHEHLRLPPTFEAGGGGSAGGGSAGGGSADGGSVGGGSVGGGSRSLYVVPSSLSPAAAEAALDAQAPVPLRVAIDVGYDEMMSETERKSLATQCSIIYGIAAQAEHRDHVCPATSLAPRRRSLPLAAARRRSSSTATPVTPATALTAHASRRAWTSVGDRIPRPCRLLWPYVPATGTHCRPRGVTWMPEATRPPRGARSRTAGCCLPSTTHRPATCCVRV